MATIFKRNKLFIVTLGIVTFGLLVGVSLWGGPKASAARYIDAGKDDKYVLSDETINENVYIAGKDLESTSNIAGDLIAAGSKIVIKGNVSDNLVIAGSRVEIDGSVGNDVVIAAGTIVLNGDITGDVRLFSGAVYINSKSIGGDLHIFAQDVTIDEAVSVKGDKQIKSKTLKTEKNSVTTIDSAPTRYWDRTNTGAIASAFSFLFVLFQIISFIGWLITGLVLFLLFPTRSRVLVETLGQAGSFARSFLWGLLLIILGPILGVLLLFSLIGIPLLITLALIACVALIFGGLCASAAIGNAIVKLFSQRDQNRYISLIVGVIVVGLIGLIPFIGGLMEAVIALAGLGAFVESRRMSFNGA